MAAPLVPATLAFKAAGTPYSAVYDDVYHSSAGGPAQARHVFLAGNGLPERWHGRDRFTILETGFGLGLNFLSTWAAWREDRERSGKLHFVSIEKHPFGTADLARLHAPHAELSAQAGELRASWPMLVPGMHRLEFESGRVVLTLYFGDVADALRELHLAADAFFLDGFSPAKNPAMWSDAVLAALARHAGAGATLATYSAAGAVREGLQRAGFAVEKRAGFGPKRDMLCGRYMGLTSGRTSGPTAERTARAGVPPGAAAGPVPRDRRALVIGAGLAGSAVCERLAARGWEVSLIERHASPAREASGNHAGVFHPLVTRDDSHIARLSRASFLHGLRQWRTLDGLSWSCCGVLQMARDEAEDAAQRSALAVLGYPPGYASYLDAGAAARATGVDCTAGGVWFPEGGWLRPPSLVASLLDRSSVNGHFGVEVDRLTLVGEEWTAYAGDGQSIAAAPVAILANAHDATRLAPLAQFSMRSVRGQVSHLPQASMPELRAVLLRGGFALPPVEGIVVAGASYDIDENDPAPRIDSHAGNLERLARLWPGAADGFDPALLDGRVGFRAVAPDRLPLLGPMPGTRGLYAACAYASRGILWSALMAELLASRIESEPWPIERRLAEAVDPGRFERRAVRRR